jgi:hypothetical protein
MEGQKGKQGANVTVCVMARAACVIFLIFFLSFFSPEVAFVFAVLVHYSCFAVLLCVLI